MPTEPVEPDETVEPVDPAIAALLAVINRVDGPKMQDMEPAEARAFFKKMVAVDGEPTPVRSVTDRTVRRDWERARLLLSQMLGR